MDKNYGNKGDNLIKLSDLGFNVPKFTVLGKDFFKEFLEDANLLKKAQAINKKNGLTETEFINLNNDILSSKISKNIKSQIDKAIEGLSFPIAIRSSSSAEDGKVKSGAGMFYSGLNVDKDSVYSEVKKVLASLYKSKNELLFQEYDFNPESYYMGIIFQEMVNPEYSGVAFSSDPITGDTSSLLIEFNEGLCENIVNGTKTPICISLDRKNGNSDKYSFVEELKNNILDIEKIDKTSVDIEWAYKDGKIYILQYRPITTIIPKPKIDNLMVFSMSKLNDETYKYLSYLQKRYPAWVKKAKFFKFCEENGFETAKWKFVVLNKEILKNLDCNELFKDFYSDSLSCHFTSYHKLIFKSEFKDYLANFINNIDDNSYCVSIKENLPNESCAISTINPNGTTHIEFFYGKMRKYNIGSIVASQYDLDDKGNIINENIAQQVLHRYDKYRKELVPTEETIKGVLNKDLLKEIFEKTKIVQSNFGNCTAEWWICNGKLYASDISLLKNTLDSENNKTISNGKVRGRIFKLPEIGIDAKNEVNQTAELSVKNFNFDINKSNVYLELEKEILKMESDEKIIIHCDKPYLWLAPFLNKISGFVFDNASSLCHLSLILREQKIPAISINDDTLNIEYGQLIELNANKGAIEIL